MSLWYQSLSYSLYGCGENQKERARCILSYLSMPVPRSWWENALRNGYVGDTCASLLYNLRVELSDILNNLRVEEVSSGLLVALAFVGVDDTTESGLATMNSQTNVEDYLFKAKEVLAKRPDLDQIGALIDEKVQCKR